MTRLRDLGTRKCENCQSEYEPVRVSQRFCANACRDEWHNDIRDKAIEHYKTCPLVKKGERDDKEL